MRIIRRLLLMAIAVIGLAINGLTPALGASLGPFPTSTPIPLTTADWVSNLTFPQFDPSKGSLNSLRLTLPGEFATTVTVSCISPGTVNGNSVVRVDYFIQDSGNNFPVSQFALLSFFNDPPAVHYTLNYGDSITITEDRFGAQTGGWTFSTPGLISAFTGTGNIDLTVDLKAHLLIDNHGADVSAGMVTSAALTGSVTYDYTPLPEPSSCLLASLGLIGLVVWRRRKR